jgi:hypothetical protein
MHGGRQFVRGASGERGQEQEIVDDKGHEEEKLQVGEFGIVDRNAPGRFPIGAITYEFHDGCSDIVSEGWFVDARDRSPVLTGRDHLAPNAGDEGCEVVLELDRVNSHASNDTPVVTAWSRTSRNGVSRCGTVEAGEVGKRREFGHEPVSPDTGAGRYALESWKPLSRRTRGAVAGASRACGDKCRGAGRSSWVSEAWLAALEQGVGTADVPYAIWLTLVQATQPPRPDWWDEGYEHDLTLGPDGHEPPNGART